MEEERREENAVDSFVAGQNHELLLLLQQCGHFLYHRRNGKGGQRRILVLLERWEREHGSEEGMSQKELQRQLGIKSGSISEILGKMEANGLLKKSRLASDKRKICIFLTQEGRERLESKRAENLKTEAALLQRLTDEEKQELRQLMEKLLDGWKTDFDFQFPQKRPTGQEEAQEKDSEGAAQTASTEALPADGKETPCGNT